MIVLERSADLSLIHGNNILDSYEAWICHYLINSSRTIPLRMKIPINRFPRMSKFNVGTIRNSAATVSSELATVVSENLLALRKSAWKTHSFSPTVPRDSRSYPIASGAAMPGIHLMGSWRETTRGCCSGGRHEAGLPTTSSSASSSTLDAMRRSSKRDR